MGDYELPTWAQTLGWLMAVAPVALTPSVAVWVVYKSYGDSYYEGVSFGRVCNSIAIITVFVILLCMGLGPMPVVILPVSLLPVDKSPLVIYPS